MPQPNAMHCLVVDDEPRLRRVLVRLLEGEGFVCREAGSGTEARSEEHTSELQSQSNLVCRLLLEKKKKKRKRVWTDTESGARVDRESWKSQRCRQGLC